MQLQLVQLQNELLWLERRIKFEQTVIHTYSSLFTMGIPIHLHPSLLCWGLCGIQCTEHHCFLFLLWITSVSFGHFLSPHPLPAYQPLRATSFSCQRSELMAYRGMFFSPLAAPTYISHLYSKTKSMDTETAMHAHTPLTNQISA